MAQNWHKSFALVRACSVFSCGWSHDCEELVGVTHRRWWGCHCQEY